MARREMTVVRYNEVKRLLDLGRSLSEISKTLKCNRRTVRLIRDGKKEIGLKTLRLPLWTDTLNWDKILEDVKLGHSLKDIWEEQAHEIINYSGFWKQFVKKHPEYHERFIVHRFFNPGEYCEVDYAGDLVEYVVARTGELKEASVFIGILCYSQLIFANASISTKSRYFLESHSDMYEYFGGVPEVTTCDCLKQGVSKCHIYDPDINQAYSEHAKHHGTTIVPARSRRPQDKALVEGAVKIVMRYFKFVYRNHVFYSVAEINQALKICVDKINNKIHTRLKTSRFNLWSCYEKAKLKPLPVNRYEYYEWKECRVHPDAHISVWNNYYSVPHIYRGKTVKAKIGKNIVEIYYELERIAVHSRHAEKAGAVITDFAHLPKNAQAYHENTPQNILSQAKFINNDLYLLIQEEFNKNTLGNLRKALGFIRTAKKEVEAVGHDTINISKSCSDIKMFNKFRVPYFKEQLIRYRKQLNIKTDTEIIRTLNPMLRYYNQDLTHLHLVQ
jgi:hypothetical protein